MAANKVATQSRHAGWETWSPDDWMEQLGTFRFYGFQWCNGCNHFHLENLWYPWDGPFRPFVRGTTWSLGDLRSPWLLITYKSWDDLPSRPYIEYMGCCVAPFKRGYTQFLDDGFKHSFVLASANIDNLFQIFCILIPIPGVSWHDPIWWAFFCKRVGSTTI